MVKFELTLVLNIFFFENLKMIILQKCFSEKRRNEIFISWLVGIFIAKCNF